jgi:hypothetical protein
MTREHAIEAHEVLDNLRRKSPGVLDDILEDIDLSDSAFQEMMKDLRKDMSKVKRRAK